MENSSLTIHREIDIGLIDPNPWNPNEMPPEDEVAYAKEVKWLGRLPKPVVVRSVGDRYEIVDGEHGWRAAKEAGLATVLCEVVDVDDYEAMRQTRVRNHHGTHNRAKEGRMFQLMLKAMGKPSNRQLAKDLGMSEGKIRNSLDFAEAAELRMLCAPATAFQEIGELTLDKVHIYLALPAIARDRWLEDGAELGPLQPFLKYGNCNLDGLINSRYIPEALAKQIGRQGEPFGASLRRVVELYHYAGSNATEYLEIIAAQGLPAELAHCLPINKQKGGWHALITVAAWRDILTKAAARTKGKEALLADVQAGVRLALRAAGHDPAKEMSNEILEALQEMPEYLSEATFLSLEEQLQIFKAESPVPAFLAVSWKQRTVSKLADARLKGRGKSRSCKLTVEDALLEAEREVGQELAAAAAAATETRVADVAERFAALLTNAADSVQDAAISCAQRPLIEVLKERLGAVAQPEQQLLKSLLLANPASSTQVAAWARTVALSQSHGGGGHPAA